MRVFPLAVWVLVVLTTRATYGHSDTFPEVIIGDPNQADNDILGDPITEEEMRAGMALKVTVPKNDPISKSGHFQGDIIIKSSDQLSQFLEVPELRKKMGHRVRRRNAIRHRQRLWPRGVIPYVISGYYSSSERQVIGCAMKELSQKTCLTFVPRTSQRDYVHIRKGDGCFSDVGRAIGEQTLSLGLNCVHVGIVMHEFMHAAGFFHEQSRYDRDSYVTIFWRNIIPDRAYNFYKLRSNDYTTLGLPYDYGSIMHYGSNDFAWGTGPTIVPKQYGVNIGQRERLSEMDVKRVNLLYQCSGPGHHRSSVPQPFPLKDSVVNCPALAAIGYCVNPDYRNIYCRKSCNFWGSRLVLPQLDQQEGVHA